MDGIGRTQGAGLPRQSAAAPAQQKDDLGKDTFLTLLTTQMQAQDPLNPMDNTEFVAQLSQFTSLERLENMSQSIDQMALGMAANTSAQMVSFVGKTVQVSTSKVHLSEGATSAFGIELGQDANDITVTIRDEEGRVVREMELGARSAGSNDVVWDGLDADGSPAPEGKYTVEVGARDADGVQVPASTRATRRVEAVSFAGGAPRLVLQGELEVTLGDVVRVEQ
ncbi:MAG: flagellar hook assembly protein FlgD [Myxococcota bacterium]